MTEEKIIDECFNCKKKKDMGDNWRTCKLKCSYKYKRKENDYITRLEQDSKQLTQWLDEARRNADFWCNKCTDLEQENKELKEKIKKYSAINEQDTKDYVELKRENIRLFNESIELRAKNIEYKHTLEEIREIASPHCSQCVEIIDKINEVLQ